MPSVTSVLGKRQYNCGNGYNRDCDDGLSYGTRVGIGIGIVALFLILAAVITAGIRRRRYNAFVNSANPPNNNPNYSNPYAQAQQNQNPYMNTQLYGNQYYQQNGSNFEYQGPGSGTGAGQTHYPPPPNPPKDDFETVDGYRPPPGPPPPSYQPKET